jgi:hypothetical protein
VVAAVSLVLVELQFLVRVVVMGAQERLCWELSIPVAVAAVEIILLEPGEVELVETELLEIQLA